MQKYWTVFKLGWQEAMTYRGEFFLSISGWIVRLIILFFIWSAVFEVQEIVGDYNFKELITYFIFMVIISTLIFSRIGFNVAEDIHTGDFANYLLKPISYMAYHTVGEFGKNLLRLIISGAIIGIPVLIFLPEYMANIEPIKLVIVPLTIIAAYLLNTLMTLMIGLSGFWVTNSNRIMYVYFAVITVISGINIPLDLFPEEAMNILFMLPFSYVFYFPIKLIISPFSSELFLQTITGQIGFLLLFFILSKIVYQRGIKKFEAVGR